MYPLAAASTRVTPSTAPIAAAISWAMTRGAFRSRRASVERQRHREVAERAVWRDLDRDLGEERVGCVDA